MTDTTHAGTSTIEDPVRTVDGHSVPAAGNWAVDTTHSSVEFVARHLMITKVRGRFSEYTVDLTIGERPEDSRVDVTIQTASITTGDPGRDGHLLTGDFLDAETHPTITFSTTSVSADGSHWKVSGDLTVKGVSRPVVLDVEFGGVAEDPWGNSRALFSATTVIDRDEFGVSFNQPLAGGGVLIGKKIAIELEVQAVRG